MEQLPWTVQAKIIGPHFLVFKPDNLVAEINPKHYLSHMSYRNAIARTCTGMQATHPDGKKYGVAIIGTSCIERAREGYPECFTDGLPITHYPKE